MIIYKHVRFYLMAIVFLLTGTFLIFGPIAILKSIKSESPAPNVSEIDFKNMNNAMNTSEDLIVNPITQTNYEIISYPEVNNKSGKTEILKTGRKRTDSKTEEETSERNGKTEIPELDKNYSGLETDHETTKKTLVTKILKNDGQYIDSQTEGKKNKMSKSSIQEGKSKICETQVDIAKPIVEEKNKRASQDYSSYGTDPAPKPVANITGNQDLGLTAYGCSKAKISGLNSKQAKEALNLLRSIYAKINNHVHYSQ